jgi:hypothetical protein
MTPLMILIGSRIEELKKLIRAAKEENRSIRKVRLLQERLNQNNQILNLLQRQYYEKAEAVHPEKEYLN